MGTLFILGESLEVVPPPRTTSLPRNVSPYGTLSGGADHDRRKIKKYVAQRCLKLADSQDCWLRL